MHSVFAAAAIARARRRRNSKQGDLASERSGLILPTSSERRRFNEGEIIDVRTTTEFQRGHAECERIASAERVAH